MREHYKYSCSFCLLGFDETESTWHVSQHLAYCTSLEQSVEALVGEAETLGDKRLQYFFVDQKSHMTWRALVTRRHSGKQTRNRLSYGTATHSRQIGLVHETSRPEGRCGVEFSRHLLSASSVNEVLVTTPGSVFVLRMEEKASGCVWQLLLPGTGENSWKRMVLQLRDWVNG
jgi:hypothetical protein